MSQEDPISTKAVQSPCLVSTYPPKIPANSNILHSFVMNGLSDHWSTNTVVGTPSKSKRKAGKISKCWGPERVSKYICHLGNIIAYLGMKNHEILSF